MAAPLTLKPTHPALFTTGLLTPPLSPIQPYPSPTPSKHAPALLPPVPSYAMLRQHHATAIRYVIAKLRWEQTNNGYLRNEDAWHNHIRMITKLEAELADVEAAQKGLDRFPNCFAATAKPAKHGPLSKEEVEKAKLEEKEKMRVLNERLDAQFPFIQQLFIGPRTKNQARNDKMLRECLADGDFDDLSVLLPSENMRFLMEGQHKKGGAGGGGNGGKKQSYQEIRMEREKAKIAAALAAAPTPEPVKVESRKRIGPMTKEEWRASLPKAGPLTKGESLLPVQREQRHVILTWLRQPWSSYDEDAAHIFDKLARLALKKMDVEGKHSKGNDGHKEEAHKSERRKSAELKVAEKATKGKA